MGGRFSHAAQRLGAALRNSCVSPPCARGACGPKITTPFTISGRLRLIPMKTKIITAFFLAASGFTPVVFAQALTTPPPVVSDAPTVGPAPTVGLAPTVASAASAPGAPSPNQTVYTAQLPTVQELTNSAAASGVTLTRVEQTTSQVTVVYQLTNGQVSVVSYQLLPAATGVTGVTTAPIVTTPPPRVVYIPTSPRVVYYDSYPAYDPWYWYSPVSLSIGLGFHGGGYYRGGFGHGFHHGRR
jgi:hypothetical protein